MTSDKQSSVSDSIPAWIKADFICALTEERNELRGGRGGERGRNEEIKREEKS